MPTEILLPALSASMTDATIVRWMKQIGDTVAVGDVLVELETDKSNVELEAEASGTLAEIFVPNGSKDVPVGTVLARLLAEGEGAATAPPKRKRPASPPWQKAASDEPGSSSDSGAPTSGLPAAEPPVRGPQPDPDGPPYPPRHARGSAPAVEPEPPQATAALSAHHVRATPLARRMAQQAGIDPRTLVGSGPGGRVAKIDVESALRVGRNQQHPVSDAAAPFAPPPEHSVERIPHSRVRRAIARRLSEAKRSIPHFYLRVDCNVDALIEARRLLNESRGRKLISLNDLVVRAAALALRRVPEANVSWTEEAMLRYARADVAVAVATDHGLVTPVIRSADVKSISQISDEMRRLADRARLGKLSPDEYDGGTITVSNLGMYGMESIQAVINPPQACIIGVGAAVQRPVIREGNVVVGTTMSCTLSADHRAIDGAIGARFLGEFRTFLERPIAMLL